MRAHCVPTRLLYTRVLPEFAPMRMDVMRVCVCVCMDGCVGWSVVLVEHGASNSSVFHSLRFLFVSFFPFSPSLSLLSRSVVRPFHFSDDPFRRFEGFAFKSFRFFGALCYFHPKYVRTQFLGFNSMPRR